jgi:enterochelin esterase-like enzyme
MLFIVPIGCGDGVIEPVQKSVETVQNSARPVQKRSKKSANTLILLLGLVLIGAVFAVGCEPLAPLQYDPSPVAIVITNEPTATVLPTLTPTPTITRTPLPSPTPDYTPTPTPFPCDETAGQILDFNDNRSENGNGENLRYRVYVPPCYFSLGKRFPVIYLLHGLSYREQQWEELGLLQAMDDGILDGTLAPAIIVMPYLGNLGQFNQFPPDDSYEGFLLDELMPQIERNFCTLDNATSRAIGGISRGGFWAYTIAFRHSDLFGIVAGHSAYFPNNTREIPPPVNPLELAQNDPNLPDLPLRMYLDNGANDSSGPSQQLFSSRLSARGIAHTYVVHPTGEHNNDYWSRHVAEYLDFYGREWERDYNALPSCSEPSP